MLTVHDSYRVAVEAKVIGPTEITGQRVIVKFQNGDLKLNHREHWDYSKSAADNVIEAFNQAVIKWEEKGHDFFKNQEYVLTQLDDRYVIAPIPSKLWLEAK